jgi:hypothetical protein
MTGENIAIQIRAHSCLVCLHSPGTGSACDETDQPIELRTVSCSGVGVSSKEGLSPKLNPRKGIETLA